MASQGIEFDIFQQVLPLYNKAKKYDACDYSLALLYYTRALDQIQSTVNTIRFHQLRYDICIHICDIHMQRYE